MFYVRLKLAAELQKLCRSKEFVMRNILKLLLLSGLGALALPVFAGCGGPSLAQLRLAAPTAALSANPANLKPETSTQVAESFDFDFGRAPIVGLWDIKFYSGGQVVDEGFDAWHNDGTEILNDTPPPVTGNVCLGVWTQTGRSSFKLKHPSWIYDPTTNTQLAGQAIIRENVTVSRDGNSFPAPSRPIYTTHLETCRRILTAR